MYQVANKKTLVQFESLWAAAHWARKNRGQFVETCPRCNGAGEVVEHICDKCQGVGLAPTCFRPDILPAGDPSISIRETVCGYLVEKERYYHQSLDQALERASQLALKSGRQFIRVYHGDYTLSFYRDPNYRPPVPDESGFPAGYGEV